MTAEIVVTEEDGIRIVRMNRPDKKNALTQPMYAEITRVLREAEASDAIRCVILAGCPGAFCAGSDISDFQQRAEGGLKPVTVDFLHALVRNPKPLLAAVDGLAIGIGTTMLLHCDYVVATSATTFATPFTKLGLIPEAASSLLGPMRMGHARAFALLVMGRTMSAEEAKAAGLINAIVDSAALDSAVLQAAREVAGLPAGAVALARKLMRGNLDDLLRRVDTEAMYFKERLQSDEARAAFAAFLARKK
jgi:enoyl-CoA hydratase/carnithine racemase